MRWIPLSAAACVIMLTAGCAGHGYYDDYGHYHHGDRYSGDRYHDGDRYRDDDRGQRVRVCDADGDDCHWEYRRPD